MLYKGELPGINQIVAELVNRLNSEIIQVVCFCKKTVERLWGFNISLFRFCEFDGFNGSKLIFLLLLQQQNLLEKSHMATNLVHPSENSHCCDKKPSTVSWQLLLRRKLEMPLAFRQFRLWFVAAPAVAVASCACANKYLI